MDFVIVFIMVGLPILVIASMIGYIVNKIYNHKKGITKADYPIVAVGGKMKKVHPESYFAKQARKKGQI